MKNIHYQRAQIHQLIVAAGQAIDRQIMRIREDQAFSDLHTAWCNLYYLTSIISPGRNCFIRLLDLTVQELVDDIKQSAALQYTVIYNLVYHREFDTQGGSPFGLLVIDFPVNLLGKRTKTHLYLLSAMAHIGQDALCPVIFPMDEQWLAPETDRIAFLEERILRIYNSLPLADYRALRRQPHSLYLGLVWPGGYLIHKDSPSPPYKISGAICLAACVIKEFDLYSWFSGLQCWGAEEDGGAILPAPEGTTLQATLQFSESLDQLYSRLGIMLLSSTWLEGLPGFFTQTLLHRFPTNDKHGQQATKSEEPLPWLLIACRAAHYLKVILRENIGQVLSPEDCRQILDKWIQKYCLTSKTMTHESYAKFPFNKASVRVASSHVDGSHMTVSLELSPNLPPGMIAEPLALKVMHKKGNT